MLFSDVQKGDAAAIAAFGKTFDGIHFKKGLPPSFCIHKDTLTSKVRCKSAHPMEYTIAT